MPAPIPALRPKSGPLDLLGGLWLPLRALGLTLSSGRLFALTAVCAFVTAGVLLGLVLGLWPLASYLADRVVGAGGWRSVAGTAAAVVTYLVLLVTFGLTLPSLVLAPLTDPLSEAVELALGGFTPPPFQVGRFLRGVWLSARHTLARLALMIAGQVVLFPLGFIPVAGPVLYAVLSVAWSAWWVCTEYVSSPAARHLHPVRKVFAAMRQRPFACLGLGLALYLLLWVPVLDVFLVPTAVVAGTLLYRQLDAAGAFLS